MPQSRLAAVPDEHLVHSHLLTHRTVPVRHRHKSDAAKEFHLTRPDLVLAGVVGDADVSRAKVRG